MSHGLPVISHTAPSMGQKEQIGDAGDVVEGYEEYADVMKNMIDDYEYYRQCVTNASMRYNEIYNVESIINRFVEIYKEVADV